MLESAGRTDGPLRDAVRATWLRQAGFLIEGRDAALLIDAFLDDLPGLLVGPARAPEDVAHADVVLATHEHGDHLDLASWRRIAAASPRPIFVVPAPLVDLVRAAGIGGDRIVGATPGHRILVNNIEITPVPARHGVEIDDAYDFGLERSGGQYRYLGYVIAIDDVVLYHAGDTIVYEGMEARLRSLGIHAAFLPINGRDFSRERRGIVGNLHPREAADLASAIGAQLIVPMHFGTAPDNTESPATLVSYVAHAYTGLSVMVPGHGATFGISPGPTIA